MSENQSEEVLKAVAQELTKQLYADLKNFLPFLSTQIRTHIRRMTAPVFHSPTEIYEALRLGNLADGDILTLESKPSLFAPFERPFFLSSFIGHSSDMRLGPQLIGGPHPLIGMVTNFISQLTPIGILPPLNERAHQAVLYQSESAACAFSSFFPGVNEAIPRIPAILESRYIPNCNLNCNVRGAIRQVPQSVFSEVGGSLESYEGLRQSNQIWYLDVTGDDSRCAAIGESHDEELWGGLYASSHLEILQGSIGPRHVIGALRQTFESEGLEPKITENKGSGAEISVNARGLRGVVHSQFPVYSIHMDANVGNQFAQSSATFRRVTSAFQKNLIELCAADDAYLLNESDFDFYCLDAAEDITVLQSAATEIISDPLARAIRGWHMQRNNS